MVFSEFSCLNYYMNELYHDILDDMTLKKRQNA